VQRFVVGEDLDASVRLVPDDLARAALDEDGLGSGGLDPRGA
jgi:hypothetical protein